MNSEHVALLQNFLGQVGIPAKIEPTKNDQYRIVVPCAAYAQRRAYINAWFTPIGYENDTIILAERLRGTGSTDF